MPKSENLHIATVFDLSSDGWGVVKASDGRVVFVPQTWLGDEIEFEIVQEGKFNLGRVQRWIGRSTAHRDYECAYHPRCGGCPWGGIVYSEQVKAKAQKLTNTLERARLQPEEMLPFVAAPQELAYRNRLTVHQQNSHIGLHRPLSNDVVDIERCLVSTEVVNNKLHELRSTPPLQNFPVLLQEAAHQGFVQGNSAQNQRLREQLAAGLGTSHYKKATELFCGDGNFTELLQTHSEELWAYESGAESIERLVAKSLNGVRAQCLDLYAPRALPQLIRENSLSECLLLDPPRSGYKTLRELVVGLPRLRHIIYVSCNPMTFARDVAKLGAEWKLRSVQGFDLFPQTPHVELMAFLQKSSSPE